MQPPVLLHIGYPKTASTWLQTAMFGNAATGFEQVLPLPQITETFLLVNEYRFSPGETRDRLAEPVDAIRERGHVPVISNEWLAGNQVTGAYHGRRTADRLHATYPDAMVLVLLREQSGMIASSYREYVSSGGHLPVEEFLGKGAFRSGFEPVCRLDHLEYHHLVERYLDLFGADRVVAVPFEQLRKAPEEFYAMLCDRCGVTGEFDARQSAQNVGLKGKALSSRRTANGWLMPPGYGAPYGQWRHRAANGFTRLASHLPFGVSSERIEADLSARIESCIEGCYRESNRILSSLLGLDLADFGYDV